ncbi:MAG: hypothetical protein KC636_34910, partial [Myxococcales bacterium]|nr:hypothetical protein [Myxococcales bacterium]
EPTTDEPTTDTTDTTDEPTTDTTDTTDDTSDTDPTDTTDTGGVDQDPPQNGAELLPWLEGGAYKGWKAESAPHPSTGPHFGTVRTYINDVLFESLESMNQEHPMGAAAIKELYGDGDTVLGWSVEVKFQANSDGGNGWYWYENYNGNVFADGDGVALCYGCHAAGNDYFRSPYPLQ